MPHQGVQAIETPRANKTLRDFGRAFGGALIFSLPIMMTSEMWSLGFTMDSSRLLILLLIPLPLLMGLSYRIGFESSRSWGTALLDSLLALGVAGVVSCIILTIFGVIGPTMGWDEILGKVGVQIIPGAIGALLARSQLGAFTLDDDEEEETYGGELFLMGVGALFMGLNIAPTEEVMDIAHGMTDWHALALMILSPVVMHGFVFAMSFSGGTELSPDTPNWSAFARYTLPGFAIALLISFGLLWLFGRMDESHLDTTIVAVTVLAFPSAIGAAAARLIL